MPSLTAEKVAGYLPLAGKVPHISGRIINVTHQIPYHISRSTTTMISEESSSHDDSVSAAPVSKLARHHHRRRTLRAKFHAAEWTITQSRGHLALHAGLQSLRDEYETLHIGWTGPIKDKSLKTPLRSEDLTDQDKSKLEALLMEKGHIIPIFLDSKSRGHYEGYCKEGKL
jgi:trehalose 6-phosphate synthase/phosphatase